MHLLEYYSTVKSIESPVLREYNGYFHLPGFVVVLWDDTVVIEIYYSWNSIVLTSYVTIWLVMKFL